ncbi:MAG: DUF2079 domain-containing protein, partial [bacterium]|nr:DUF2079 domain-containing protein [bacterium]
MLSNRNIVLFFFFLVFSILTLPNHYFYRTFGLDYGIANQALFQYAHFQQAICTQLLGGQETPYLALHISLWVPIISPFYWLFGSYTLLIFQNLALIFGGIGLVKLAQEFKLSQNLTALLLVQLFSSFAIYAALAFDYHDNVIGACFIPWLFYFYKKDSYFLSAICFLALLISKENMAIFAAFTAMSLGFVYKENGRNNVYFSFGLILIAFSWFFIAAKIWMPALSPAGKFEQLSRFSHLGNNLESIIIYIISHPIEMLKMFYFSHIQPDSFEMVKQEFIWVLFLSGGFALLFRPIYLWMALPILMQKLWNKELAFWGMSFHYQIELAFVISLALLASINSFNNNRIKYAILISAVLLTAYTSISYMQHRLADYKVENENLFDPTHYFSPLNISAIQDKLAQIPANVAVCAQSNLMPHLANRNKIYHFPY